ncbi:MAG: site-specific integrase [Candidatus Korobacteraceae bacterium]
MLHIKRRHLPTCKQKKPNAKCMCPVWVDGMQDGRRIRYSLDTSNWEEASRRLLEITADKSARKESSVKDAADSFLTDCERRELKASGSKKYKELLAQLKQHCANRAITTVRALDIAAVKVFMDGWQESSLVQGKKIERMRTFFRYCQEMGWTENNPATNIKKPKVTNKPVVPFSPEEVEAIIKAVDLYPEKNSYGHNNRARMLAFILTLRYTGLRIGDVVKLSRNQVQNERVLLHTQKTGAPVHLPLPQRLLDALKAIENDTPYYFWTGTGGKGSLNTWDRAFRKVLTLAGVKGHAHMFRHTMAIELLEKGITVEQVAAILGNSPAIVYKHYAPWIQSRQKALDAAIKRIWA